MTLHGTQSLVTGASSGIGLAIAKQLAAAGSYVWSLDNEPPLEVITDVFSYRCDIRKPASVTEGLRCIPGPLHLLVNNAGVLTRGNLFDVPVRSLFWTRQNTNDHGRIFQRG